MINLSEDQKRGPNRPRVVHFNRMWKYHGENPPRWLITTTGSNPESMESTGTSSNDKVQSDLEALNAPIQESEAIGNTTTSGVTAPAQSDGESAPRRVLVYVGDLNDMEMATWDRRPLKEGAV